MKKTPSTSVLLKAYYSCLFESFGPQGWWPANTRFEMIVGAILTQNTAWTNVEKAISNLKGKRLLTPEKIHALKAVELAALIRPAGYFNIKAKRLKNFTSFLFNGCGGSLDRLLRKDSAVLRRELLDVNGVGPETADSIILYAAGKPEFVIDAYTKRIFSRHGLTGHDAGYDEIKTLFMENLPKDAALFNEYHALIVKTAKDYCRTKNPLCSECPLKGYL
ncbi:MAG: endonuclease III domain-containing protein [Deltaproteobacteria bacterium]|nr:endonuclease III domain-containing protein [Deltaproteobacteria bacterium]